MPSPVPPWEFRQSKQSAPATSITPPQPADGSVGTATFLIRNPHGCFGSTGDLAGNLIRCEALVRFLSQVTPANHPPPVAEDIRFNAIAIAESLDRGARTGKILLDYLGGLIAETELPFATIYRDCSSADAFREFVGTLTTSVYTEGLLPVLHIEAHGSLDEGIYFADDSILTWPELCQVIRPLRNV